MLQLIFSIILIIGGLIYLITGKGTFSLSSTLFLYRLTKGENRPNMPSLLTRIFGVVIIVVGVFLLLNYLLSN